MFEEYNEWEPGNDNNEDTNNIPPIIIEEEMDMEANKPLRFFNTTDEVETYMIHLSPGFKATILIEKIEE